ncbi:MAG: nitroreductase [Roseovarius sp.]|nr:nitroreductase [Roseovarius sp.]
MGKLGDLLQARYSCRAYRARPVEPALLREILGQARGAPSGGNLQAWSVVAMTGPFLEAFGRFARKEAAEHPELAKASDLFYPNDLPDPYRTRRREAGHNLYRALGIDRRDFGARTEQMLKNYQFFGAPVGLIVHTDARMVRNQWLDIGAFVQSVCLLAADAGLATCIQGVWTQFRRPNDPVKAMIGLGDDRRVACGMALGYPDARHPANAFRTDRTPIDEYATFLSEYPG